MDGLDYRSETLVIVGDTFVDLIRMYLYPESSRPVNGVVVLVVTEFPVSIPKPKLDPKVFMPVVYKKPQFELYDLECRLDFGDLQPLPKPVYPQKFVRHAGGVRRPQPKTLPICCRGRRMYFP